VRQVGYYQEFEKCVVQWMKFNLATIQRQDNIVYK